MTRIRSLLGDAISLRAVAALLGGRLLVRATLSLIPLALAITWPHDTFAAYAAAMAQVVFVVPLLSGGVEKSALKYIPRRPDAAQRLVGIYLGLLAALILGVAGWTLLAAGRSPTPELVLLASGFAITLGLTQVLVAMHRALGRIWLDVVAEGAVLVSLGAGLVAARWFAASAPVTLAIWVAALAALDIALVGGLWRLTPNRGAGEPGLVRTVAADAAFQGATDVVAGVSVTVILAALTITGRRSELPGLYVVLSLASLISGAYTYILRLLQPAVAVRLRGRSLAGSAASSAIWRLRNVVLGALYALALLVVGRRWMGSASPATWHLAILFMFYLPVLATAASVHFVFENGDAQALRTTIRGGVLGLGALTVLVVPLAAWAGVVGALTALAAGDLVHLAILVRSLRGEHRSRPAVLSSLR